MTEKEVNEYFNKNKQNVNLICSDEGDSFKVVGSFNHPDEGLLKGDIKIGKLELQLAGHDILDDVIESFESDYHRKLTGVLSRRVS